ncbi:GMC oxidoreductase [Halomarina oriensis]|uniref:NAD(P)-binding protein n=1 Tax=Halomarina oriensis TaxID=671145 RepID=A0A6B0GQ63_9EURY|nr:NAD(P)-binding protein [Halomarina oriensis]
MNTDVCIVGTGPAGALVGCRLAEAGHDVVLLEAGPRFDGEDEDRVRRMEEFVRTGDWRGVWEMGGERDAYTSEGRHYPLNHARVKGVGGSSLHWHGMVMRFHESDFERRTRDGVGVDWPIGYDDLRPYYAAAERELGVAGADDDPHGPPREEPYPMPAFPPSYSDSLFASACERLGVDMHSAGNARNSEGYDDAPACVGYGTCKPVCPSRAKYTAERHVARAEAAGATVVANAPVQRLATDANGERVVRVVYTDDGPSGDGEERTVEAEQFVLAAGGVETPRLLLLSADERTPDGLANSSGAVGRYFMDHLYAGTGGVLDDPTRQKHVGFNTSECHQFYDDPTAGASGTDGSVPATDADCGPIKLEFVNYAGPAPTDVALDSERWGDELLTAVRERYGQFVEVGALVGQLPRAENRVELDPDRTDDHGNPVPRVVWDVDDRTRRTVARANEIQEAILDELGAERRWQVGPEDTGPAFHHMGTTRMGTDPETSVVDPNLRTHDHPNCSVVSSSVFPTGGAMNPTLTIAALALRAADRLDAALR